MKQSKSPCKHLSKTQGVNEGEGGTLGWLSPALIICAAQKVLCQHTVSVCHEPVPEPRRSTKQISKASSRA